MHNKNWGRWKTHQVSNSQGLVGCHSVVPGGWTAQVLKQYRPGPGTQVYSLVEAKPKTGRASVLQAFQDLLISFGDGIKSL